MSRAKAPPGLPGVALASLELPSAEGAVEPFEVWELRACDLEPGGWARRLAPPRLRRLRDTPLRAWADFKRKILWVCVRQHNLAFAQSLIHEAAHAVHPAAAGTKRGETWSEVSERTAGALLRAGVLRLTLRDRQIDAVRRQLLGGPAAAPYEAAGRLEPRPGGPWAAGLGPSEGGA